MSRKGKLESSHLSSSQRPMSTNRYGRWRVLVEDLLASRWMRAPLNVQELAATVVGMFDAGADDSEVAAFLLDQERTQAGAPWLTDAARLELVHDLHMSAGSLHSMRPPDEDL